jgi:deoxycytidine triphosphate deaminase
LSECDDQELNEALVASVLGRSSLPPVRAAVAPTAASGVADSEYEGRSGVLLGSFGKLPTRSYSLTDLQDDPGALDAVFSGRPNVA